MTTALRRTQNLHQALTRFRVTGVFAETDIQAGEIIEECYTLILKEPDNLMNYTFKITNEGLEEYAAMPLGSGAIFNHSSHPNADYELNRETMYMVFTATRPIKAGEEIFITYGDHWFAVRDTRIKQASASYQLKRMLFHDTFYRRLFLVTAAIVLLVFTASKHRLRTVLYLQVQAIISLT